MTYRIVVVARANPVLRSLPEALAGDATVQIFDSANEALWSISTEPPDLVLSELELDEMSGLDLAEIVPNFDPNTRVVLWGSGITAADRARAKAAGVSTVLSGDVSLDAVRAAVSTALQATHHESTPPTPSPAPVASEPTRREPPAPSTKSSMRESTHREPPVAKETSPAPEPTARRDFTPARIVLPSRAEREAAERAAREAAEREAAEREAAEREASTAKSSLAARSRAAVERRAGSSAASSSAAEPPIGWRSDGRNLIVTEQNIAAIRSIMGQLGQDLGTQSIMLTDRAGMILVETGDKGNLPLMVVLPLLSTGFSTTGEVARQLREEDATSVYIHEGVNIDLYCFDVAQRFLLVLVFNKRVASSKIGAVWVNAKRAIRELREVLAKSS
ncbi:response regulator [Chloroflexus aggregans]|uniref:Response regulator receiver protein n=1 Tax=Chloroflexus aggregans (strain MD-66 / DSM 9485) TaxID=326427 RepID=B8G6H3_CHLAD|nr:response regulator [Chloroflexus aggregans]ACL23910.1 response regulator receiver protein [Chloroflexus aggregans DSM 9485]